MVSSLNELKEILRSRDCASLVYSSITNKMQHYTMVFIIVNALHVSGGSSTHHQELKNCIHSIEPPETCRAFIVINTIV
jgi:hypothetical protein